MVVAGCSVLDINDYENHYPVGEGHEDSPGKRWEQVGPDTLLGYNYSAPLDSQGSADIVATWLTNRGDPEVGDVEAWRDANNNSNGRNACAIKKGVSYHYFAEYGLFYLWKTIPKSEW